ncbi:neurogenic protein mastermind [Ceratitis capitata]|uniref:(Mediterranean fruit fly) hypothetical protein n=3 Tax=Ceratitis capitata TaxID=7213 RepID=A0A811UFF9_CERCA|nr:neurogenic protein mastermind [Ceratitis capitata]CAD6996275.1 unnamed protein product [Ceratitis capitata]
MTYSHNSVSNKLKMTTSAAVDATTVRLKKMPHGGGVGNASRNSPLATSPVTAHSNSIASSTNYPYYYQQQQHMLSSSPPGCPMSSGASTSSNCSDSSLGSSGIGGGHMSSRQRKQKERKQQQQQQQQQQQRNSPQPTSGSDSDVFFNNNNHQYQTHSSGGRRGGSNHKQRDGQRSPNAQHQQQQQQQQTRQSPAVILGGGGSPTAINSNGGSASRKPRAKFAMTNSPLFGKISPTQMLLPTALTHFAGSKCFDAPAPTALPKPPEHWTLGKAERKSASSAGPGLHNITTARNPALAVDAHTCGGHVVKHSKRNLLDDFDTHNLKLLLNVQS